MYHLKDILIEEGEPTRPLLAQITTNRSGLEAIFVHALKEVRITDVPDCLMDLYIILMKINDGSVEISKEGETFLRHRFNCRVQLLLLEIAAEGCSNGEFEALNDKMAALTHKVARHEQMMLLISQCSEDSSIAELAKKVKDMNDVTKLEIQ